MGLLGPVWRELIWEHWIESLMELLMCRIGHHTRVIPSMPHGSLILVGLVFLDAGPGW